MIDLVSVGAKISHFREENGYSQEALASKLFVSRQAISAWEVGKSAPSIDNIIAYTSHDSDIFLPKYSLEHWLLNPYTQSKK